jgi:hypothetical protein
MPRAQILLTISTRVPALVAGIALVSCQAPAYKPDYSRYDKVYDSPSTLCWRGIMKNLPYVCDQAFHGQYGGCGNAGGKPCDRLDALCRKHDIVYGEAKALPTLRMADQVFAEELGVLDCSTLSANGRKFRENGIHFMQSPWADIIGKPLENLAVCEEPADSPFQDIESIRRFFHAPEGPEEMKLLQKKPR